MSQKMKFFEKDGKIIGEPDRGQDVLTALREAINESIMTGRPVLMTHNGRPYQIIAHDIPRTIVANFQNGAAFGVEHGHA